MSSIAETELRVTTAGFFRRALPEARIVHELVVGPCRADIAVIEPERLILVELKSSRDTLTRLSRQADVFRKAAHHTIVVADERWWIERRYGERVTVVACPELEAAVSYPVQTWHYPKIERQHGGWGEWQAPKPTGDQPHARKLLSLLWKAELLAECGRAQIAATTRTTCEAMVRDMAYLMTGREIAQAVCRQLRGREFPNADATR